MTTPSTSICAEAERIVNGPRRESYGPAEQSFQNIASTWSLILRTEISPQQVALCMIALKLLREANSHSRDNLVDIAGYAELADKVGLHIECEVR